MKILNHFDQGSLEWLQQRVGKITMSHAKELLTGGKGKTRQSYIMDVVAEKLSGQPIEGYYGLDMERGNFLEPAAGRAFTEYTSMDFRRVGFVLSDDERIGCSPDGLTFDAGIEIKCPRPRQHIRTIYADGADDYIAQIQGCMWLCQREHWHLVSFCPWVEQYPLFIRRIDRDDAMVAKIEESAMRAADEVETLYQMAVAMEQPQGIKRIAMESRAAWENAMAEQDIQL